MFNANKDFLMEAIFGSSEQFTELTKQLGLVKDLEGDKKIAELHQ
jgi:hypothetical protein